MAPSKEERLVKFSDDEIERLTRFYTEAESEILAEINKALLRANKTEYLKGMLANVQAILDDLEAGSRTWSEKAIPRIYLEAAKNADEMLKQRGEKLKAGFGAIHQQAGQVLAENAFNRFNDVTQFIGRRVEDIYRTMSLEAIRGSVAGYKTWQQAAKSLREKLAAEGITGFRDKKDRKWNMRTYASMVAKTTTMEAHLQGTANRLLEHGHDLIKVSTHAGACKLCRPWERKILSLTGRTPGYPTLEEAKATGLFHPNCRHAYGLYIDLDAETANDKSQKPKHYVSISDLPEITIMGLAKAWQDALKHGKATGTETLLHIDAKSGETVYFKVDGEQSQVEFTPELIEFLKNAEKDSVISVHNHPGSSSFSVEDLNVLRIFPSIKYLTVIGHNESKYILTVGTGKRPQREELWRAWQEAKQRRFDYFRGKVMSGEMTQHEAWYEHSHLTTKDVAQHFGWEYRRIKPNEE